MTLPTDVPFPLIEENMLLRNLGGGDMAAFWPLWLQHRLHLYGICLRHMGGVPADAADAVSRSMLLAFNKLPAHADEIQNLQAWLTRLTRNVCIDMCRERQRITTGLVPVDDVAADDLTPVDPRPSPEAEAMSNEMCSSLHRAIAELPPLLRQVAQLRFLYEAGYDTIASRLAITEATARKRVQQARMLLRLSVGDIHKERRFFVF
ncbi:MAG TPA: RNA polymerase sigma factor [Thermoanaerobaculia bacterium]|jgi:RNA polymerase sigma-70 factor (ECF subfamily)